MFPTIVRGQALAISVLFSNVGQFMVNFSFLPLVDSIGDMGTFSFYCLISILGLAFVVIFVVETKEKEPSAILNDLTARNLSSFRQKLFWS